MVFWSFWVFGLIVAHQTAKFKLSGQFRFSRHPWGPWGRQSSGVIWNETKSAGHCAESQSFKVGWADQSSGILGLNRGALFASTLQGN